MNDQHRSLITEISALANPTRTEERDREAVLYMAERDIARTAAFLHESKAARLVCIAASDNRQKNGSFNLDYVFSLDRAGLFVTLSSALPQDNPETASISSVVPAANVFEREAAEFFGIRFTGSPDARRLLLHDDWPADFFPLRKDAVERKGPKPEPFRFLKVEGEGIFEIPVGPVHAGIIEPGHFRFSVAGEPIINLEIKLGYVHKGIEKQAETLTAAEGVKLAERISGDASFAHSLAFCQAAEKLGGISVPARGSALRVIFAEMERLYTHFGDIAGIATDVGFVFGAAQMLRLRELVLQQNKTLYGHRLLRGVNTVGGVAKDIDEVGLEGLEAFLFALISEYKETEDLLVHTDTLIDRIEKTGTVKKKTASALGAVGPAARACGINTDLRRDFPYCSYDEIKFKVPLKSGGDVACRMAVKIAEVYESIGIISPLIVNLPDGPICSAGKPVIKQGSAMGWAESSRGEIVHRLTCGADGRIERLKIKSPSFVNWTLLPWAVRGDIVPDFPLVNKSFNLSYSGNDR